MISRHLLYIALLALSLESVFAISFTVLPNREKCLREEFKPQTKVDGFVDVSSSQGVGDVKLNFRILGLNNAIIYQNMDVKGRIPFTFVAPDHDIEYGFCFIDIAREGRYNQDATRTVSLQLTTEKRKDYSELAKKDHLKPIEVDMLRAEDDVVQLMKEFVYMKDLEAHHRDTSESTNSRVKYATILSSVFLISLGVGQIFYLKKFFKTKKLI